MKNAKLAYKKNIRNIYKEIDMKFVLIGIQGAGKSTQGNLLSKQLNIEYLSSGHIFREMAKEKTPIGRYLKEIMNSGALIPDENQRYRGYILDGFHERSAGRNFKAVWNV